MKDSKGNGFTTSNPSGAAFDYFGVLVDKTSTDSQDWSKYEWSYIKGKQGDKGTSVKSTEVTYQIGNSATTPPTGAWSTSIVNITDANPYLWTRTIFVYDDGSKSNPSYSVATRGTKGAVIRQHRGFESGKYKYLSGSGAEEYLDVVYYNGSWYRCLSTYETSSPSVSDKNGNSPRWEIANNFKMIATDVLLAKNASIDMVGTNQINLFYSSGTKMYGSFRVVGSDSDYALWLGGTSGKDAAFSVTGGGKIKANSGSIGAFEITNFTDATGFTFYGLKASHSSTTTIPACDTTLDYSGIGIWSGKNTASDYINIGVGYNGSQDGNSNPSFRNGGIYITGNTSGGASDDLAAIYVGSLTPKSGYRAYALDASNGDIFLRNGAFIGAMRPNTSIVSYSRTLGENDCFVVCTNSSSITLTLPSNPREGQMYYLYQANGTVNISSTTSHSIISKGQDYPNGKATWYSGTKNQLSILVYTGSRWYVAYTTG